MAMFPELLEALGLPEGTTEEDVGTALLAAITLAVHDEEPRLSLNELSQLIHGFNAAHLLSPLDTLSVLLPSGDPASRSIIRLLGIYSPAKEVIMAVQEALERLKCFGGHVDDNEQSHSSPQDQLILLIGVYASAIPRLKLRRKSASDTLRSLMVELEKAVRTHGDGFSTNQGRSVIRHTSSLVQEVSTWIKRVTESTEEQASCNEIMMNVLSVIIETSAHCIQSCAAKRAFAASFPTLVVDKSLTANWEEGEQAIQRAVQAACAVGFPPSVLTRKLSISRMILLAHAFQELQIVDNDLLSKVLPGTMSAFQSSVALDECLALLLNILPNLKNSAISPEIITPLCTILSSVASTHPDPSIRHQCFRILSLLLSHSPPTLRLEALKELTTDPHLPQMRTAAVGLVKEAVLEGLASSSQHIFASRVFIQVFAPILFRTNPQDFFSKNFNPEEMHDSYEASRLIECLSLYYVLLQRDKANKTGIRDRDIIINTEKSFLAPLRMALARWEENHVPNVPMPIISLQISIERVENAIAALDIVKGEKS
ncbi:YAP/Alf4/glomulin domain containing protein [Amanita muscaria]